MKPKPKNINSTVFKILLVIAVLMAVLLLFKINANAEEVNILQITPLNLQGDTVYLMSRQDFGMGIGWNIATVQEFIELRAETVFPIVGDGSSSTLIGAGLGINIPKLIEKLGGEWIIPNITSSLGLLGLFDFNAVGNQWEPAIYLTIVKVNF